MTTYTVSGTVPQPTYNPRRPYFDHDPSTRPPKQGKGSHPYPIGEAGRRISVTTKSARVADQLAEMFKNTRQGLRSPLLEDVTVEVKDGE